MASQSWSFHNPVKVLFGLESRKVLARNLGGQKLLMVTTDRGREQFAKDRFLGSIQASLTWSDGISQNPGLSQMQAEVDRLAGQEFSAVVAFGGGSAIDAAKALAAALAPGVVCRDLETIIREPAVHLPNPILPIHAVTTTSGTGAEVTPFATLWDYENRKKLSLASPVLFPRIAVVDPELTYGLPSAATLFTSLDALNQAFESVWNKNRSPITIMMAARAIQLSLKAIPRLHSDLDDHEARSEMAEASVLAGLCISQTRTAICHSVSYPLTVHFGIPHGLACAATMSVVAEAVLTEAPSCLTEVAQFIGLKGPDALVSWLNDVLDYVGLQDQLASRLPDAGKLFALRDQMLTPGRSENFILPANRDRLEELINQSFNVGGRSG